MSIRFICDSTCDYTQQQAEELAITLVPLKVLFGEEEYYDGVDIKPEAFYEKLESSEELPTTSQPSPEAFLQYFREAKEAGDDVICILLASRLSGTCQSALVAKDIVEYDRIYIVDSMQATLGTQLLIERAFALQKEGKNAEQIVGALEEDKKKVCIYLIVDTLLYLQKGGRLSAAGMAVGSALNLKPVLAVRYGEVKVAGLARGQKGAWDKLFKAMEKEGGMNEAMGYNLGFTGKKECLDDFARFVKGRLGSGYKKTVAVGSVIGVHVGPGANALAVFLN